MKQDLLGEGSNISMSQHHRQAINVTMLGSDKLQIKFKLRTQIVNSK